MAAAPAAGGAFVQLKPEDVEVGDWLDVRDVTGAWCGCRALEKTAQEVLVQTPQRWGPCTDLWLPLPSPRVAPFRRFSQGPVTSDRKQSTWEQVSADCRRCSGQLAELEEHLTDLTGSAPWTPGRITSFLCGDVPDLVDRTLNFAYAGPGAGTAAGARALEANRFFLQFLRFFSCWLRAAPRLFQVRKAPPASTPESAVAACAAALPDLAGVLGRTASAAERRAASLFEAHPSLPERFGAGALWPGAEAEWLRKAVAKAAGTEPAAVPWGWLVVKLRGVEEPGPPLEVAALEEALQRSTLLQCNAAVFCAMGGIEGLLGALALGQDAAPGEAGGGAAGAAGPAPAEAAPLPLEGFRALLVSLSMLAATQGLSSAWADVALPRLLPAVRGRVTCMRDEEVKVVDRDQILRCICEPVVGLLVAAPAKCSRAEIEDLREELLLLFHRRRLQSPFLEKRLKALGDIKDVVDRATSPRPAPSWTGFWGGGGSREPAQQAAGSRSAKASAEGAAPAAESLLSPGGLAWWLADEEHYGLLPILFGARAHTEVLRRSAFLLRLLARERLLTRDRLTALWACGCSADKHEDLTSCALDLLVEIASVFDLDQVRFLVGKVTEVPAQALDVKFLRFLRDLLLASGRMGRQSQAEEDGAAAGKESGSPFDDGLAVFWRCLRADEGGGAVSLACAAAAREARACFLDLLRNTNLAGYRHHYLQACWNALRDSSPPPGSLVCLFREILGTFPEAIWGVEAAGQQEAPAGGQTPGAGPLLRRDAVLWQLGRQEGAPGLSNFLLDSALAALSSPAPAPAGASGSGAATGGGSRAAGAASGAAAATGGAALLPAELGACLRGSEDPPGRDDLAATLLETLFYVLTESSLQVSFEDMRRLWQAVQGGGQRERDLVARCLSLAAGFTFASKVFGRPNWMVWPESAYTRFFQEVLRSSTSMDYAGLSRDGLICFVNYMKLCNLTLFNSGLQNDMLYIPETPNCSYGAGAAGTGGHGGSGPLAAPPPAPAGSGVPSYSQLVGRDGLVRGRSLASAVGRRFRVVRWGLAGAEELWEIAWQVRDPDVFEACSDFLASLHVFVHASSSLHRRRGEVQTMFLHKCMSILEEAPTEGEDCARRAHKALALLAKFVRLARLVSVRSQTSACWPLLNPEPATKSGLRGRSELSASFHISFRSEGGGGTTQQRTFYIQRSATLGQLRCKVAAGLQLRPRDLALYAYPGLQLVDRDLDCLTLEDCQVPSSLYAALARSAPAGMGASAVAADGGSALPLWQLAEKDVDTFLNLLTPGNAPRLRCEAAVWAILGCLPIHEHSAAIYSRVARWGLEAGGPSPAQDPLITTSRGQDFTPGPRLGAGVAPPATAWRGVLRRPLSRIFEDGNTGGSSGSSSTGAPLPPLPGVGMLGATAGSLAEEFKAFWNTKVWVPCSSGSGPQTHRLLYGLRVIYSLMLGDGGGPGTASSAPERLPLPATRGEGGHIAGEAWSLGFLRAGGLELLLGALAQLRACRDAHALLCFSLLAECVRELLSKWQSDTASSAPSAELGAALRGLLPPLAPQLLEALLRVVGGEYVAATNEEDAGADPRLAAYSASAVRLCLAGAGAQEQEEAGGGDHQPQHTPEVSDAGLCATRLFALLHTVVRTEPGCAAALRGFGSTSELLARGLLGHDAAVREAVATGVRELCMWDPSDDGSLSSTLLAKLLFEVLPRWHEQPGRSAQLFCLLARLLRRRRSAQPAATGLVPQQRPPAPRLDDLPRPGGQPPLPELLASLMGQLHTGGSGSAEGNSCSTLLGMLQMLHSVLHCFPSLKGAVAEPLAAELLRCCLGAVTTSSGLPAEGAAATPSVMANVPQCRTGPSRQAALALLLELATDDPAGCLAAARLLLAAGAEGPAPGTGATGAAGLAASGAGGGGRWRAADWVILPDTGAKSAAGFVGLKNLGATCYMNSVLQQLFAHPEFRRGVLDGSPAVRCPAHAELPAPGRAAEAKEGSAPAPPTPPWAAAAAAPAERVPQPGRSDGAELFYQLQVMFSSLRSSERQYYSPTGFCTAFRDWEGRPVNVLQQMDADEFLNLLMDQLERAMGEAPPAPGTAVPAAVPEPGTTEATKLGPPGGRSLLRRLLGGRLCTEIIPKSSAAPRSERQEDFLVLSLQVKGKPSVHASLAAFVEGETLEGDNAYYSEEAACKVDAEKRTSICHLPETLVLGLKRFEFDLDAMQKVKVNDLCEFPMRLNMWPYTKRALDGEEISSEEEEALEYTLCGIVLHSGTSDSGHYSSLVKVSEEAGQAQWYEFNDTLVTPFNEEDIPKEAYGGSPDDDFRGGPAHSRNAYLLLYKRATAGRDATAASTATGGTACDAATAPAAEAGPPNEAIQRSVESANCLYWHVQALFSAEYADFAWMLASNFYSSPALLIQEPSAAGEKQLLESVGALKFMQLAQLRRDASGSAGGGAEAAQGDLGALPLLVCQLVISFLCTVLARSRDRRALSEWSSLAVRMLRRAGRPAQRWFAGLLASHGFVREMLLECPLPEARTAVLAVAAQALRWLYESEASALRSFTEAAPVGHLRHGQQRQAEPSLGSTATQPQEAEEPLLAQIWATLLELLPAARLPEAHLNFQHFFLLLQDWLRLGPEPLAWARKAGGLDELLEFALQDTAGKALPAALDRARRWYRPNPLRVASPQEAPVALPSEDLHSGTPEASEPRVSMEAVLGLSPGDNPQAGLTAGERAVEDSTRDTSFERQLRSDLPGDAVELGALWGILALLLEAVPERTLQHSEENDALLRRLVRLGGATAGSRGPASRLLRLLCRGDLARSQGVVCRICERVDESDGRALRAALRMGTALVDLGDTLVQQRCVFLLKSVLHVAKNNRKYFRPMHLIVHYIVKWCRRRPELSQWLLNDAGSTGQYRWLEAWVKDNANAGGNDGWQGWQAGGYPGQMASGGPPHGVAASQNVDASARWNWCSDMLPLVRRIVRGEPLPRGEAWDSDGEANEAAVGLRERPGVLPMPKTLLGAPRMQPPVLSKVQMVNALAASARTTMHPVSNLAAPVVW